MKAIQKYCLLFMPGESPEEEKRCELGHFQSLECLVLGLVGGKPTPARIQFRFLLGHSSQFSYYPNEEVYKEIVF